MRALAEGLRTQAALLSELFEVAEMAFHGLLKSLRPYSDSRCLQRWSRCLSAHERDGSWEKTGLANLREELELSGQGSPGEEGGGAFRNGRHLKGYLADDPERPE